MPNVINFDGPKTCSAVITSASLNGLFGQGHDEIDESANKLRYHLDEFTLEGPKFEGRLNKFKNTAKVFFKAGACSGAMVSDAIMLPADLVTGRGKIRPAGESFRFIDEGLLGNGLRLGGVLASGSSEIVGAGLGGFVGVISLPGNDDKPVKTWIKEKATSGAQALGKGIAHVVGTGIGVVLDAARLPSIAFKYLLKGVFGITAGLIGVIGGAIRAIINK